MKAIPEPWKMHYLPPPDTRRWVANRKKAVVTAVEKKLVTRDYVIRLYGLSSEELDGWIVSYQTHGAKALSITKIQNYRTGKRND